MLNYKRDKEELYKNTIRARKKELNYLTPKKNKTDKECQKCLYSECFTPYSIRCDLISYDDYRIASINCFGCCDAFNDTDRQQEAIKKYNMISYENITFRDVRQYVESKKSK